jgi:hypothetical protein
VPAQPPRIGSTLGLIVLWIALYVLWLAVR